MVYSGGYLMVFISTADPLYIVGIISISVIIVCFVAGLLTGDYSWVDRLWSILPFIYSWIYVYRSGLDSRVILISVLITIWGIRLTYNFARKGGYGNVEDYRWQEVKKGFKNKFLWQFFNFLFISFYQNLLFVLFTLPVYVSYKFKGVPLNTLDLIATVFFICLLILETIADQQQWNFQQKKRALMGTNVNLTGDFKRGFFTGKLFKYSRHPNFFAEISMWWMVYLFSIAATGSLFHWSITGTVLLTLLFQGSTSFTEKLSSRKYPDYKLYQKTTSRIIPWFSKGIPD